MNYTHIPEISCFYSNQPTDDLFLPSAHFEYQMILATGGKAKAFINHKSYSVERKSLIFISRMERHSFAIEEEPYERMVVSMSGDLIMSNIKDVELISLFIQRPKNFCHVVQLSDAAYDRLYPLFVRMCEEYTNQPIFYVSRSASLVIAILIDLYRIHPEYFPCKSNTNISEIVLNTQRCVNDCYSSKISLQTIALENHISRGTLSIAFKEIVGITFKDYLVLFRISEAKKLLVSTDLSISDISENVGYENVNNFIQIFKKVEHMTPLKYRKQFTHVSVS